MPRARAVVANEVPGGHRITDTVGSTPGGSFTSFAVRQVVTSFDDLRPARFDSSLRYGHRVRVAATR